MGEFECGKMLEKSLWIPVCRLHLEVKGFMLLLLVIAVLHTLDRQGEYVARTDFLWKAKLKVEQEEVETMRGINKVRTAQGERLLSKVDFIPFSFRFCWKIFCQLTWPHTFCIWNAPQSCTTRVTPVWPSCSPPYPTTRSSTMRQTSTSRAWSACVC